MLVERLTFQAKYGHGDTLVALFEEWIAGPGAMIGVTKGRIYTDATGPMFTIQVETEFADLNAYAAYQSKSAEMYATSDFADWFGRMQAVTEKGERQLFNVKAV